MTTPGASNCLKTSFPQCTVSPSATVFLSCKIFATFENFSIPGFFGGESPNQTYSVSLLGRSPRLRFTALCKKYPFVQGDEPMTTITIPDALAEQLRILAEENGKCP